MDNRNIILVKLSGGLGNQLFQFSFGSILGKQRGIEVVYFTDLSVNKDKISITQLVDGIKFSTIEQQKRLIFYFKTQLIYRACRKLILTFPVLRKDVLIENGSYFKEIIPNDANVFDGYWQSYKYLIDSEYIIRNSIIFPKKITDSIKLDNFISTNSVFVHIRRGDYMKKKNKRIFEICHIDYYKRAMRYISSNISNVKFFIFSDDIEWAKANISSKNKNVEFVHNIGDMADLKDFYCMMNCKHAIIPNSTFSWWAAWLINYQNKIVIAPKGWYKNSIMNKHTDSLIPDNWIRL